MWRKCKPYHFYISSLCLRNTLANGKKRRATRKRKETDKETENKCQAKNTVPAILMSFTVTVLLLIQWKLRLICVFNVRPSCYACSEKCSIKMFARCFRMVCACKQARFTRTKWKERNQTEPNQTKIPNEWINRIAITTILWRIKNELFQKCMRVRQNRIMFVFSRHEIDIPFAIPARCCVQCSSLSLSLLPLCQSCSQRTQQTHRTIRFKVRVYFILIRETVQLPKRKMR